MVHGELSKHVACALQEANVLPSGGQVVVGLSGGADSVGLLLLLNDLGYSVVPCHCNFHLRGAESDADEGFCRELCQQVGVPLRVVHFDTRGHADEHGISIEMAARVLRYDWFAAKASELGAQAVCVAHHSDDAAETLLLNLIRGTGLHGLSGMRLRRVLTSSDGKHSVALVRPLLTSSRSDIEQWLREQGATWVTDSSNLDPEAAVRNTIRLQLLPLMQRINPAVAESLNATARRLHEAELVYDHAIDGLRRKVMPSDTEIDVATLLLTPSPQAVLHAVLSPLGFTSSQVEEVAAGLAATASGAMWHSSTHRLLRDRGRLLIDSRAATEQVLTKAARTVTLPLEGVVEAATGVRIDIRRCVRTPLFSVARTTATATFDLEKLSLPLCVRLVRPADRLRPFGMTGSRLVSDVLTDAKLSVFDKERQLVVTSGETIVWVVGIRAAAGFEVDAHTRHVMTLTLLA